MEADDHGLGVGIAGVDRPVLGGSTGSDTEVQSWMEWMSHRKRKETKQQPGTARPGNILGCCLVYLRFLCNIHSIHSVQQIPAIMVQNRMRKTSRPNPVGPPCSRYRTRSPGCTGYSSRILQKRSAQLVLHSLKNTRMNIENKVQC